MKNKARLLKEKSALAYDYSAGIEERTPRVTLSATAAGCRSSRAWQLNFLAGLQFNIGRDAVQPRYFIRREFMRGRDLRNRVAFARTNLRQRRLRIRFRGC